MNQIPPTGSVCLAKADRRVSMIVCRAGALAVVNFRDGGHCGGAVSIANCHGSPLRKW